MSMSLSNNTSTDGNNLSEPYYTAEVGEEFITRDATDEEMSAMTAVDDDPVIDEIANTISVMMVRDRMRAERRMRWQQYLVTYLNRRDNAPFRCQFRDHRTKYNYRCPESIDRRNSRRFCSVNNHVRYDRSCQPPQTETPPSTPMEATITTTNTTPITPVSSTPNTIHGYSPETAERLGLK